LAINHWPLALFAGFTVIVAKQSIILLASIVLDELTPSLSAIAPFTRSPALPPG